MTMFQYELYGINTNNETLKMSTGLPRTGTNRN